MNNIVDKQVLLHLATYPDDAPTNETLYVVYLLSLTELYRQRYMLTWIHLLLIMWLLVNVGLGIFGAWFAWLPVLTMAFLAVVYRLLIRE